MSNLKEIVSHRIGYVVLCRYESQIPVSYPFPKKGKKPIFIREHENQIGYMKSDPRKNDNINKICYFINNFVNVNNEHLETLTDLYANGRLDI